MKNIICFLSGIVAGIASASPQHTTCLKVASMMS